MPRARALSNPTSPSASPSLPSTSRLPEQPTSLTQAALAQLSASPRPPRWPPNTAHSYPGRKAASVTPSATSVSEGDEIDGEDSRLSLSLSDEQVKAWVRKGKGKEKERNVSAGGRLRDSGLANTLPPEILVHVSRTDRSVGEMQLSRDRAM